LRARSLLDSFNYAFDGVVYTLKTQRNMRLHFLATALILLASLIFKLTKLEILILFLVIAFVIVTEMINTAIEVAVDLVTQEIHPLAAIAKNVAAGAVLVASTVAVIIGYMIFFPKLDPLIPMVIVSLQKSPIYLSMIAITFTVVFTIAGKALTKTGRPVQGGMPSGHTALAAASATAIFFLTRQSLVTALALFLLFLVAESRIENKIHTPGEVLVGGLLGFLTTTLIFQLLLR
jgi:diacylglycerol kinase (ATP)